MKFLTLRVTPPAHPEPDINKQNVSPKGLNTWDPHGHQKPPNWTPKPSKIDPQIDQKIEKSRPNPPKWSQEGARMVPKSKNNIVPTKRAACHSAAPFWRKMWPTWFQVGFPNRAKALKHCSFSRIRRCVMGFCVASSFCVLACCFRDVKWSWDRNVGAK